MTLALLIALALPSLTASAASTETPTPAPWQDATRPDLVAIFPNPCAKIEATVGFWVESGAPAKVLLYSESGAVMTEVGVYATAGANTVLLDLRGASPGIYYVRVHVRYSADRVDLLPHDKPAKFVLVKN